MTISLFFQIPLAEYISSAKLSRTGMEKLLIETSYFHRLLSVACFTPNVVLRGSILRLLSAFFPKTPERGFNDFTMLQMSTPTPPQYSRTSARSTRKYELFYVIIIFTVLLLQVSTVTALTRFLQRVNLLVTHQFTGRI